MDWSGLKTDLEAALEGFDGETDWTGTTVVHQHLIVPDLSKCERLAEVNASFMKEKALACFDDENIHHAANQGQRFSRDAAFAWLVWRSLYSNVSIAVDNLRKYIENSTITAYQIVFVDGLYCASSDDEIDFSQEFRICHLRDAPVRILRSNAFRHGLLGEQLDYVIYKEFKTTRQITKAFEQRDPDFSQAPPSLEPIEDRISLLSLATKKGFQIARSSFVLGDDVPLSYTGGLVSSGHSRRAPVPIGPGIIAPHTRQAEELFEQFSRLKTKQRNRLRVPLRKLNDCLSTNDQVQQMVDFRICLEALFLDGNKEGEYRYRLALRAAIYTADTGVERRKVFKAVRDCYDLGSTAVHSGEINITPNQLESVEVAQNAVRAALIKKINGDTADFDALILGVPVLS